MAVLQSTFKQNRDKLFHGTIASTWGPVQVESWKLKADTAVGIAVQRDSNNEAVKGIAAGADSPHAATNFIGIVIDDPSRSSDTSAAATVKEGRTARVLTRGDVALKVASAVAAGAPATVTKTTGAIADDDASATIGAINGYWLTAAAANGIAILRLHKESG